MNKYYVNHLYMSRKCPTVYTVLFCTIKNTLRSSVKYKIEQRNNQQTSIIIVRTNAATKIN